MPKDPLTEPFTLKGLEIRNRIMSTSHACGLEEGGMPVEKYQAYQEEKARGGIGLTMFGGSSNVDIDSPSVFQQLNVGVDEIVPHLKRLSDRVHEHGAAIMCQITHLGRRGQSDCGEMLPTIAPSVVRETLHRSIPKEMDRHDIDRVTEAFARAAARCRDGGLDGLEVHASSHLVGQFFSPMVNRRTDGYGGSLANRCRFGLEVFEAMRRLVGDDYPMGLRLTVDETGEDGLGFDDCVAIAKVFQDAGTVDFFNAMYGRMDTYTTLATHNMPGMSSPIAPWLEKAAAFRREVRLPVFHAARISDIATARYAVREGLIDLVGMTRGHIADPHIVRKIEAGEEDRIRPCVGATHCMTDLRPACLHNAATGRETVLSHRIAKADKKRRIVVVGAGPAGLEAARVSAERGHDVVVFEAAPHAGGQVLLAVKASWRKDMVGIVDWRVEELQHLGVEVRYNVFADEDDVMRESPDVVIIATGGIPNEGDFDGSELVTSPWDIISGEVRPDPEVLVVDGTGRHVALTAAEVCISQGAGVRFVSVDETLAQDQGYAERVVWRKWAAEQELDVRHNSSLCRIERTGNDLKAHFINELTESKSTLRASQVVYEYGTLPMVEVYEALRRQSKNDGLTDLNTFVRGGKQSVDIQPGAFELHRIGDAVSSRNIHFAVLDALRLCSNI